MRLRIFLVIACCAAALALTGCKPRVSFEVSNTEGAPPLAVTFTGTCQTVLLGFVDFSTIFPIKGQIWDFGDGGDISESLKASHTYEDVGKYTVSFAATNLFGTTTVTRQDLINVTGEAPSAAFTASVTSGDAPLAVNFTDTSGEGTKEITSWVWDFGDGESSNVQNPSHTFPGAGTAGQTQKYTVTLTVSNVLGSSAHSVEISASTVGPEANFTANHVQGDAPYAVAFTDSSTAGSFAISSWEWNFGDGGASSEKSPSHTYEVDGKYTVTLRVATPAGVSEKTRENYIEVKTGAPAARFRVTDTKGLAPFDTSFKDLSIPGKYEIDSYAWDFGDGGHSTAQHPLHTFQTPGTYTIVLTVTTQAGTDTETKTGYISVYGQPQAAMSVVAGSASGQYTFTDTSELGGATLVSRLWDFGDGSTHDIAAPIHTYASPGTYTATLTITVNAGEAESIVSTVSQEITVAAAR